MKVDAVKSLAVLSKLPFLTHPKCILIQVPSFDLIQVPSSCDRKWGRQCWTWCECRVPLWLKFQFYETEDEEAEAGLDMSSEFHTFIWVPILAGRK